MVIMVKTILQEPVFERALVLSGSQNLDNIVGRVSIFDCPIRDTLLDAKIINPGDLFISGLNQFLEAPDRLADFINLLANTNCSALFILNENLQLITPEIIALGNSKGIPIIAVDKDISYAAMMDAMNKLISLEYHHIINGLKLNNLLNQDISQEEHLEILDSINPSLFQFTQALIIKDTDQQVLTHAEIGKLFFPKATDSYIFHDHLHYFIFSESNQNKLIKKADTYKQFLPQFFHDYSIGISMIHSKKNISISLNEAQISLNAAISLNKAIMEYDSKALFQLVLLLKDKNEPYQYLSTFLKEINALNSENGSVVFETIKQFVHCKGSYQQVAVNMNQHENTIRYRINRARQLFGLEDDIVNFHATISMLTAIDDMK